MSSEDNSPFRKLEMEKQEKRFDIYGNKDAPSILPMNLAYAAGVEEGERRAMERVTRIIRELREARGPRPTWGSNQVTGWANYMKALDRVLGALRVEDKDVE